MHPIRFTNFSLILTSHTIGISLASKNACVITVCRAYTRGIVYAVSLPQLNGMLEIRVTDLAIRKIS